MQRRITILAATAGLVLTALTGVELQAQTPAHDGHVGTSAEGLAWGVFQPPGFPTGARIAIVHGDPAGEGPYVVRISLPDGYVIPAHYHSGDESLTVLSGIFMLADGASRDETALRTYRAGDFLFIPREKPHFGGAKGPTLVQIHGIAPFTTTVVEPVAGQND